ncbi:bifunctional folylpolyglutamate synthase/dihydrofolate synthase [Helicobacter sp. MIT 05-5293]|uniref:Mur ligase family protein n=1 Tax=Helicobacter sp. MIT 05-5293 TaxID=1548149 RepID=UPI00051DC97A|nr:Mur ligase family protein [Helicobacter sp. MIT 05-5293]TLD81833.1 bifunctional folylpolyglutamate synthase/dihydrofolate synthase [Helicobacter sp. MIT 05-5293]
MLKHEKTPPALQEWLISKGEEYAPFDPLRAKRIYDFLKPYLNLKCRIIHLIGTNGKGSTGRFIAMGLEQHHKKVLHFSSPHLFDFTERFYCNGKEIDAWQLEQAHQELWQFDIVHQASYFEYATFLALILARECEYLVFEAGLGGEFDSTSVVESDVSVFTLIGTDHQEILGESIEQIAQTKFRAMGQNVILAQQYDDRVYRIAYEIAQEKGASMRKVLGKQHYADLAFQEYVQRYDLPTFLQDNLCSAIEVLHFFGMKFDFENLKKLSLRGRFEMITPRIIVDVGHNIDGARAIRAKFREKSVILVYNSYREKNIEAILRELLPIIKKVLIISVENFRICPRYEITKILEKYKIDYGEFCIKKMRDDESYLVFGSFSVVQEFLKKYQETRNTKWK